MLLVDYSLFYYHFPKTGGTSTKKALRQVFGGEIIDDWGHSFPYRPVYKHYRVVTYRNPLDMIVSRWWWGRRYLSEGDKGASVLGWLQTIYHCPDLSIPFDYIMRFENLQLDFNQLCERYNKEPITLPREHIGINRPADFTYKDLFKRREEWAMFVAKTPQQLFDYYNIPTEWEKLFHE